MNKETFPIWNFSPSHVSIGFSQIAFPTIVLPKDDRTNSFQEEQLGLPYWTMIWASCASVGVSKYLDTPILDFLTICVHLPFWPGCKLILRLLLVLRIPGSLEIMSMTFVAVICDADDSCSVNTAHDHLSQCHLGVRLNLCISEIVVPTPISWDDRDPSMTQNELFWSRFCFFPAWCVICRESFSWAVHGVRVSVRW